MAPSLAIAKNRRGIYEFILTKSIMLIFILALVGIFVTLYNKTIYSSAEEIASSEARKIATQIDDVIGFKGVSNTATIHLTRNLMVGKEIAPYALEINEDGVVLIRFVQYPYQNVTGIAKFGMRLQRVAESKDKIDCDWLQISNGASLTITKDSINWYNTQDGRIHYNVSVTIDASKDCYEQMKLFQDFTE